MKKLSEKSLSNVALFSLGKSSGSRKALVETLERKVERQSAVAPAEAKVMIDQVVTRMETAGYVDDVRMAEAKSASLQRQGKSSRAIEQKLRAKGIDPQLAKKSAASTPEPEAPDHAPHSSRRCDPSSGRTRSSARHSSWRDFA